MVFAGHHSSGEYHPLNRDAVFRGIAHLPGESMESVTDRLRRLHAARCFHACAILMAPVHKEISRNRGALSGELHNRLLRDQQVMTATLVGETHHADTRN